MKTVEEIAEQFKGFYFLDIYTGERNQERILKDITEEEDEEIKNNNTYGWYWEELEFAKLATIARWERLRKGWYQNDYYDKIVNTANRRDVKADETGMIENVGVSMSKEEFETYKQVKQKLEIKWEN